MSSGDRQLTRLDLNVETSAQASRAGRLPHKMIYAITGMQVLELRGSPTLRFCMPTSCFRRCGQLVRTPALRLVVARDTCPCWHVAHKGTRKAQ